MPIMKQIKSLAAATLVTTLSMAGSAWAQDYSAHQNFHAHTKKCTEINLGLFKKHVCSPDVDIAGTVYEKAEFSPDPKAEVRLKITHPFSLDTGYQGVSSNGCVPQDGVNYFGQGVSICTYVKDVHVENDHIKFDMRQSAKLSIGIPHVKTWSVELSLWHHNFDLKK